MAPTGAKDVKLKPPTAETGVTPMKLHQTHTLGSKQLPPFQLRPLAKGLAVLLLGVGATAFTTAFSTAAAANFSVTAPSDDGTGNTPNTLSWAIFQANTAGGANTITVSTDMAITAVMARVIRSDMTITSDATVRTISCAPGTTGSRPFFIHSGTVKLQNLNVANCVARGGDSIETPFTRGAGGAGLGGAVFVNSGNVTIERTSFVNNSAEGSNQAPPGGAPGWPGGAGMFGISGNTGYFSGGGGLFGSANGAQGAAGYAGIGAGGTSSPQPGQYASLGGGGGSAIPVGPQISNGMYAGNIGGFGGGGGSGYSAAGAGGFGGGGGYLNFSGLLEPGFGASGSDGAGMGGAIFARAGTLTLRHVNFQGNNATAINDAKGYGGGIFVCTPDLDRIYSTPNTPTPLADDSTAAGSCRAAIDIPGSCDVTFSGNSAKTSHPEIFWATGSSAVGSPVQMDFTIPASCDPATQPVVMPVPTLSEYALLLLSALLGATAWLRSRKGSIFSWSNKDKH